MTRLVAHPKRPHVGPPGPASTSHTEDSYMPSSRRVRSPLRQAALAVAALLTVPLVSGGASAQAADAPPAYPPVGASTDVLDHDALLGDLPESEWYEANIPFVDLPDEEIQDTYYYRWRLFKEALKYTGPEDGWIVSEFLGPVGYSAPNGGIAAAAGHHIYEGRWLRDERYLDDYLDYWLRGSGSGPKPATDGLNENTTDWAHQYSFWVADAAVARARVNGDWSFVENRLPELEEQWEGWAPQFNEELGLYWQTPVWDAMEFTASSYQSDDPYHGGEGFRPTLNAYQYGDALAIATLLRRTGDVEAAEEYEAKAAALQANQEQWLWDADDQFYKHVMRDENPDHSQLDDREEIGFIPWYFDMAPAENSVAWAQLTDPQGFAAPYGPTTVERRSPWFMHEALQGCCRWDGPSWPYATSQTLTAMANLLLDYPEQPYVDRGDYYDVLRGYALTQRKNGEPYVAEAHHPDEDRWLYDGYNHSEDYNHSTFNDLVLSGLLGIRPQQDDSVRISPLVPTDWDHFAVENLSYHGRNLTVLWDRDGTAYGQGAGLSVWVDGELVHTQAGLDPVDVPVPAGPDAELPQLVDDFADVDETGYPEARASYTWNADSAANAIDGQNFHLDIPTTRWTTYSSPNAEDWLEVDLGTPAPVSDLRIFFYDDGGGVRTPTSYAVEYLTADGTWAELPGQTRIPAEPAGNGAMNRVLIDPPVTTDRVRITPVRADGGAVGITAVQSWREVDERLSVRFDGLDDGALAIRPGEPTDVTAVLSSDSNAGVPVADVALLAPRGWGVAPVSPTGAGAVPPGGEVTRTWRVTPPADLDLGAELPLRALVHTGGPQGATAGAVAPTRYQFDPADYGIVLWSDNFSTDRLDEYRVDSPFGEATPSFSVSGGALHASATGRAGALLAAPVTGSLEGTALIVEPRSFAGTEPEDSLFIGQSAGDGDNATAWYNNHFGTAGVDVRVGGGSRGDATGGCCSNVTWEPGDRFAVVVQDGTLTSWVEEDGDWRRLRTAPVGVAVDAETLASWAPAMGLRLEAGSIAVESWTVLGRGGAGSSDPVAAAEEYVAQIDEYEGAGRLDAAVARQMRNGVERVLAWAEAGRDDKVEWDMARVLRHLDRHRSLVQDDEVWRFLLDGGTALYELILEQQPDAE